MGSRPGTPGPLVWGLAAVVTVALAALTSLLSWGSLVPLGLLAGVIVVGLVVRRPYLLAPLVVVGFAVQPWLKFQVSEQAGPSKDVVIVVGVLATAVSLLTRKRGRTGVDRTLLVLLVMFIGLYVLNPAGRHSPGWQFITRLVLEALGLFMVGYLSSEPARSWRWGAWSAVFIGIVESADGLWQQHVGLTTLVVRDGYGYGQQVRATSSGQLRSFGTLDDPFNYAAITILGLVCALYLIQNRAVRVAALALLTAGVFVSYDRTAMVLVAGLFLLHLADRHRASALCLAVALAAAGLGVLTTRSPVPAAAISTIDDSAANDAFLLSINGRTDTWLQVFRGPGDVLFGRGAGEIGAGAGRAGQPGVAGVGRYVPGVVPVVARNIGLTSLDSSYVETLADVGVVGLAVLMALGARALALLRIGKDVPGAPGAAAIGVLLVIAADGLTRTSLFAFPFGFIALFLLGTGLAASSRSTTPVKSA